MANLHCGKQSFIFHESPVISAWASVAGKKESEGPLASYFDITEQDSYFGQRTWEQAEKRMQQMTLDKLSAKANITKKQLDLVISGDLLNQCIGSSFTLRNTNIPHLGLYGACSTMAESLLIASVFVAGGFFDTVAAMTSSHFASSERQYRFPLGYGGQRTPTSQWTVTGSGAALLKSKGKGPKITAATVGTVTDLGIKDANNMGAAMAPAAYETIKSYLKVQKKTVNDFDLILTGDLGSVGSEILYELFRKDGVDISTVHNDCGLMIYDFEKQDVHAGGSGCGCSASVLCGHILERVKKGELKNVLFAATGALMSTTVVQQGESIPGISHAVHISYE